ncbi:MAG: hypothetical protein PGN11_18050 [Quadrisphaera sp.]
MGSPPAGKHFTVYVPSRSVADIGAVVPGARVSISATMPPLASSRLTSTILEELLVTWKTCVPALGALRSGAHRVSVTWRVEAAALLRGSSCTSATAARAGTRTTTPAVRHGREAIRVASASPRRRPSPP